MESWNQLGQQRPLRSSYMYVCECPMIGKILGIIGNTSALLFMNVYISPMPCCRTPFLEVGSRLS